MIDQALLDSHQALRDFHQALDEFHQALLPEGNSSGWAPFCAQTCSTDFSRGRSLAEPRMLRAFGTLRLPESTLGPIRLTRLGSVK